MTASTLAERGQTPTPFAELFERVVASMSEALFVVDRIRRVLTANGAAAGLLAFDEEQLAVWRLQEAALRLRQAEEQLTVRLGRSPTVPELAQYLELSLEQTLDALQAAAAQHPVALEAPANEASGDDCLSIVEALGEDDARFELLLCRLSIITPDGQLTLRQRCVLELRFGQELTLGQIATRVGVSLMEVSRILRSTLTKLNELVDHGQIGDRSAGDEVAHAVFLSAIDHTEPLARKSSFPITPRLPQRNRPQPAMR